MKDAIVSPPKKLRPEGFRRSVVLAAVLALLAGGLGLPAFAIGRSDQPAAEAQWQQTNPRAAFWREVRRGVPGTTTVSGLERGVLIQNSGQNWRRIRNGIIAGVSPWILAAVFAAIALFFAVFGQDKIEEPGNNETVPRFSLAERWLHWITALLFVIMAVTGLSMLFGRALLIPVFGLTAFGALMSVSKVIHNWAGPVFLAGVLIEIVAWIRYNIPKKIDFVWFKKLGGMTGKKPRPHSEKINGGEKAWFWVLVVAGLGIGASGVVLDFPNLGFSRWGMQAAEVIHASLAVLFIAASFGHIYIGTIGAEGTFRGMWHGKVSAAWAKQHADLWYAEKTGQKEA